MSNQPPRLPLFCGPLWRWGPFVLTCAVMAVAAAALDKGEMLGAFFFLVVPLLIVQFLGAIVISDKLGRAAGVAAFGRLAVAIGLVALVFTSLLIEFHADMND